MRRGCAYSVVVGVWLLSARAPADEPAPTPVAGAVPAPAAAPEPAPGPAEAPEPTSSPPPAPAEPTESTESDESSKPPRPGYFTLDRLDAYAEFEGQFDQTRVRSDQNRRFSYPKTWSQTNRDVNFEERMGLRLAGTVIDPTVLTYQADLAFGPTQSHFHEDTPTSEISDDDSGSLLLYDVRLNFFTGRPLSGTFYALRRDDRINRRFLPSLNERQTGFGTNWSYTRDKLSMQLNYDHLETRRTGNADRSDNERFLDRTLNYSLDYNFTENHTATFSYEHADTRQEYQGLQQPFDTTRDLFTLNDRIKFGDEKKHELWTRVRLQEESGDFARDLFEFGPQLTLTHSDTLRTVYRYQFDRDRYYAYDIGTHRADWQLIHQLYSNLTTTVDVFGLYEEIENDVETNQYGASVDWQYNRKNPYGQFFANLALAYDTENVTGDNGVRIVLNEAHVMRDPLQVTLQNRNVRMTSIVVTDAANRRVYLLGRDYFVQQFGDVTRLTRVATGKIGDGDTVLIDYQYDSPAGGQIDTVRTDFSIEQRFDNGITPYYRLAYRNQEDDRTYGFGHYLQRTDQHRLGVRYQKNRFGAGAELEVWDDSIEPYEAYHLNVSYRILQQGRHTLDATGRYSRYFFDGGLDNRSVDWLDLALDHRWQIRRDFSTFERFNYRWQDDSIRGTTNGWDVTAGADYVIGELTAQLSVEYDRLEVPGSIEDDLGIYLRVRREFPNVLGR